MLRNLQSQVVKGMDTAAYVSLVRFQAFPFVPEEAKRRPIRYLFEMDVQHPAFQRVVTPMIINNKFAEFCRFLGLARRRRWMHIPRETRDYELVEALYWAQAEEALATRLLRTLLQFQHITFPIIWRAGTNLLLGSRSAEETESAICLLDAFAF
jgi:hypothetical protein